MKKRVNMIKQMGGYVFSLSAVYSDFEGICVAG